MAPGPACPGGALPVAEGIVISLARMNRVLEIDLDEQRVIVQPGVTNLQVTEAVAAEGFYYAPDPSSQQVCTIGGNLAENSGGAHCLKYGFTVNHVLAAGRPSRRRRRDPVGGCTGPGPPGRVRRLGGNAGHRHRGHAARAAPARARVVTLLAAFDSTDAAGAAVSNIVGAGILPAAIEMMDRLTIEAAEAGVGAGYPEGAEAVLIVELDGVAVQVEEDLARVEAICLDAAPSRSAWPPTTPSGRSCGWGGSRRSPAMGRISESYYVQDGVVPRTKLPEVLREIARLEAEHGLRVGNVFHAGDGNLHPLVLYDDRVEGEAERARELADAILVACVDAGGSITGEHGVGTDKACSMPLLFSEDDLEAMQRLRRAFDPGRHCQPRKALPDAASLRRGARPVSPASSREAGSCRASRRRAGGSRGYRCRGARRGPRPGARARGGRSHLHRRGGHPALGAAGAPRGARHRCSRSTQPAIPRSAGALRDDLHGPRSYRYGRMRDLLLGVTVVLGDGLVASSGGKVVKNVAGYDLGKLMCGSRGTLGVVCRASLRLHPLPDASATLVSTVMPRRRPR